MTSFYQKKLIEVAFPLEKISNVFFRTNREAAGRRGRDIHVWWAQQPHSVVRAILFLQLVDDPATLSQLNLTIEEQRELRRRYYEIVDKLIDEEVSEGLLLEARKEILLSWGGQYAPTREAFLNSKEQIFNYIESGKIPPIPPLHDPFAGSGTIPLEAQRLGLRSRASDINPIATLLNKAILVLPSLVCGLPFGDSQSDQVQPRELTQASTKSASYGFPSNSGAKSLLFEALTRYGKKVFGEGNELLSHYYPQAKLLITREGYIRHATHEEVLKDSQLPVPERRIFELPILAWIWVRTVRSPHPLFRHVEVPLATSFVLSSRTGEETWVEVQPHQSAKSSRVGPRAYDFVLKNSKLHGLPKSPISRGTFLGEESGFECGMSGIPIPLSYIKSEGLAGRIGLRLMAILAWKDGEIVFLPPSPEQEAVARSAKPRWRPVQNLPDNPHIFPQSDYGLSTFADLFTSRQLLALTTFSDLLTKLPERIVADVGLQFGGEEQKGRRDDELHDLKDGSPPLPSPQKVAEAVTTFLALCLSRCANYWSTLCEWESASHTVLPTFREAKLPMVWNFVEVNPFCLSPYGWLSQLQGLMENLPQNVCFDSATVELSPAQNQSFAHGAIISTAPPTFDNIAYADLSNFFYVWLQRPLRNIYPELFSSSVIASSKELVAIPYHHGGREAAKRYFLEGLTQAFVRMAKQTHPSFPITVFCHYHFYDKKTQPEPNWDKFIEAILRAGLSISAIWSLYPDPLSFYNKKSAALPNVFLLVCRPLHSERFSTRLEDFLTVFRSELYTSLSALFPDLFLEQETSEKEALGIIPPDILKHFSEYAPLDFNQIALNQGVNVYSRYSEILDPDGKPINFYQAITLIKKTIQEMLRAN